MRGKNLLLLMLCLVFLAACGGGGGGDGVPDSVRPPVVRSDPPIISTSITGTSRTFEEGQSLDIDIMSTRGAPSGGLIVMFRINVPSNMASEFTVTGATCTGLNGLTCRIRIPSGSRSVSFMLMPIDDSTPEPGEMWSVEIIDGGNYNIPTNTADRRVAFTITDPPVRMRDTIEPDLETAIETVNEGLPTAMPPTPTPTPTVADFQTPEYLFQSGLNQIGAAEGYVNTYTNTAASSNYDDSTNIVTVAVFDGGIDANHPEFSDPGKIVDGSDYIDGDDNPDSGTGSHGLQVAGIIAADKGDGAMHGVAHNARIMPLRILDASGTNENIGDAYQRALGFARDGGAFVYNNSWGLVAQITFQVDLRRFGGVNGDYILPYPSSPDGRFFDASLRATISLSAIESNGGDGAVFVWAAGNHGWNSETGDVRICESASRCEFVVSPNLVLSPGSFISDPENVLPDEANRVGGFAALPIRFTELQGYWLAVVNVDLFSQIASSSNGCGNAMAWCLAAPGTRIFSAIDEDSTTARDRYGTATGTSFAAPHVSGAIAVLKSVFPTMTAPQIVELLLMTATDLGSPGVDPVYGHGLLNLAEATSPQGAARLASSMTGGGGVMLVSDSRIESSSAFGGAFDETSAQLGAIDSFDRVFPLPLSHLTDEDSDAVFPIAHSAVAQVQTFEDEKGFWSRQTADGESLAFGWRGKQGKHRFSVQAEAADDKNHLRALSEEFDAFASSNVLSSDNLASAEWRMDINDAFQTAMRFEMGDGDDSKTHRAAFRASWQASSSLQMAAEIGNYLEKGSLLGAKFRGGLKIGGGSTAYGKVAMHYQLGKWNAVASATKGITRANDLGGIVQSVTSLHSAGFHFGIERESHRGAMRFQVSRDLSVRRGALDLSYVGGYEGNDYRIDSARINLAGNPPTRFAFLFQKPLGICKLKRGAKLSVGVGAEFIANSPRRNYQDSDTILSAAFRCGF